jgi:predicted ATPase/DNA-binding XRE family transcriptional regulator
MKRGTSGSFGAQLKALREAAGFTQEELATIAGLSVHAISALERGERRRPHVETVRALSAALDLTGAKRDALLGSARSLAHDAAADELTSVALPSPLTTLLGRETDLKILRRWLDEPSARLVTLTGPGGAGKTRLALELARALAGGPTRVVLVPLAAVRDPAFVAPAIAEALGLSDVAARELPTRARLACGDRSTLLVLDNFEQVLDAATLIADLLTSVPPLKILVTSRSPLHVRGEREYAVGPLGLEGASDTTSPADLVRSPAVRLLVERIRDVSPEFRLTPTNGPVVTAICQRLDALPLALELAAPWMKVLTAEDLLLRLEHDPLLSTATGPRDVPERQQTMNATVSWSYQLLGARERRAFRRLGALPGSFSIEAATAVLSGGDRSTTSEEALDVVASLIDKSLLLRAEIAVAPRPRYHMLETVRAYAGLELGASGERDDALEGLVRHCLSEASMAIQGLTGTAQAEWLDRVQENVENHRVGLTWLIERARPAEAVNIAWGLVFFWLVRGHSVEGLRWFDQILRLPSVPPLSESRATTGSALLWYTQGELARAREGLSRALPLAQNGGDFHLVAQIEMMFGHVEHASGNLSEARERFTRAIEGFQTLKIAWGTGSALNGKAGVALAGGDADQAEDLLNQATTALRQCGPWFLTPVLSFRATLALRRGKATEAMALVRESLTHLRELRDKASFVYTLVPLAVAAVQAGEDVWAARILGARDAVSERTGGTVAVQVLHDLKVRTESGVQARLGSNVWDKAYAAGRRASIDALLNDIDRVLDKK